MQYSNYAINGRYQEQSYVIGQDSDGKMYTLSFVRDAEQDSTKLFLASNEELVRHWISCLRKKRVKPEEVKYVVAAAKRAFATSDPIESATKHRQQKADLTDVVRLNELCQRIFHAPPIWSFDVVESCPQKSWSTSKVELPEDYGVFAGGGRSQDYAKVPAAQAALNFILKNKELLARLR